jgi:type II secretion system protein C
MKNGKGLKVYFLPFITATLAAIVLAIIILMAVNTTLMRIPPKGKTSALFSFGKQEPQADVQADPDKEQASIKERNLFRAKLQIEIPKPKSEKEIEEEALVNTVKDMALKGVWIGQQKERSYAIIDKGAQKGVWSYELGEIVDKGLVVSEIKPNFVKLVKGDFNATLKLFAKGYEKGATPGPVVAARQVAAIPAARAPVKGVDMLKDVRREGNTVLIPKSLADRIKTDNSIVMSAVAVKASIDGQGKSNGYQVVSVDRGSLAEKIGIKPNDVVQEVNGLKLGSSADMTNAYSKFKNDSKFEVRVLRNGQTETLRYEIR